jgi:hypothetical protein
VDLDKLLTLGECADWLRMGRHTLTARSTGRNAQIPAIRLSRQIVLFHPRTILVKLAKDAGVSPEVIAASLKLELN